MSIELIFDMGLFVPLPGAEKRRTIAVYMASSPRVVIEQNGFEDLQKELYLARNVHFVSDEALEPTVLPVRRLIKYLAVDYSRFEKVVTFTGGRVSEQYDDAVPTDLRDAHSRAKKAKQNQNDEELLKAYKDFHGIHHNMYDADYLAGIAQEFAATDDTRRWTPGYKLVVTFEYSTPVRADGRTLDLSDEMTIKFIADKQSEIPHFHRRGGAADNPHVLEQPPTNCGD